MTRRSLRWLPLLVLSLALASVPSFAQTAVPSPEDFLGYALGEHFTDYEGVQEYSAALGEISPLVEYMPYGTTPERRELFQLVIATPEHHAQLAEILAANRELALPSTSEARAREIAATNPAIVYFSYGVHGNESSSSEAALWTMYDLARGAPEVAEVLESAVVIIDPVTNPDGRARYVNWYRSVVGDVPNPDPDAREHNEPWPGGRYNHFYFDLNRDWAWGTQPETRARLATWDRWNPQVHVDFHEMGYNSSYFFFPAADPINPIYPEYILDWSARIGEGNAAAFDANGWAYFTGDNYDFFYPGYGDTWPGLTGAIGMTYEQGGSGAAGLAIETSSGDTLTLAERATHHWTAGRATLRTVAQGKNDLLLSYAAGQRSIGLDEPDVLLVPGEDATRAMALVDHLQRQGIQVVRAASSFDANAEAYPGYEDRNDFPAGTYLVPARQPRGRLATTLLQPNTELTAEYSYDISAWSLPFAYGVEAHQVESSPNGDWSAVPAASGEPANVPAPATGYGYLVLPGYSTSDEIVDYLELGGELRVLTDETTIAGRQWPYGTWFLPTGSSAAAQQRVTDAGLGAFVTPVASGLSTEGVDLGSSAVESVDLPNVAVLSGEGVSALSFGAHRFFLERRLGLPFDAILAAEIGQVDLNEYDAIVIPDASAGLLDEATHEAIAAWVRNGGNLVAVAGGTSEAAEIAEIEMRNDEISADSTESIDRFLLGREARESLDWSEEVPGAILEAALDPAHPLAWGATPDGRDGRIFVLHQGTRIFEPAEGVESVAYFPEDLEATAGIISEENLERLEQGAWLVTTGVGQGSVTLFADDPLFRAFWRETQPLYINALLLGGI